MSLAGVVLAAGSGRRLRPLTDLRPKALVPVEGVRLLDAALDRLAAGVGEGGAGALAVNAHHHGEQVVAAVGDRAHVSREDPPLGTAGALAALRPWLAGRDALVTNADAWMPAPAAPLSALVQGWDGERCRLLCTPAAGRGDFTTAQGLAVRYLGTCLLPASLVARLAAVPSGLYEVAWRALAAEGALDLHVEPTSRAQPVAIDCGTVADYLRANLLASGGASVVGEGALVEGRLERSVVWDGAWVARGEHLVDVVRAGTRERPVTVGALTSSG